MKSNVIIVLLCVSLVLLLSSCGAVNKPAPNVPAQSNQSEAGGDALDMISFSFHHSSSFANGCYRLEITREEGGTHIDAEELFSGGRIADAVIEEDVLAQLGRLAATYRVDLWNGFDKSRKNVADGSAFSLRITLSDGNTISAHGDNAFPDRYADVSSAIRMLYDDLMEQYGLHEDEREAEGSESS